jgi:hypothetical protein
VSVAWLLTSLASSPGGRQDRTLGRAVGGQGVFRRGARGADPRCADRLRRWRRLRSRRQGRPRRADRSLLEAGAGRASTRKRSPVAWSTSVPAWAAEPTAIVPASACARLASKSERDAALELMRTVLSAPTFPQSVLEREKARSIASIREAETRPDAIAGKRFAAAIYPDHPYGVSPDGGYGQRHHARGPGRIPSPPLRRQGRHGLHHRRRLARRGRGHRPAPDRSAAAGRRGAGAAGGEEAAARRRSRSPIRRRKAMSMSACRPSAVAIRTTFRCWSAITRSVAAASSRA